MRLGKKFKRTLTLCITFAMVLCSTFVMPVYAGKAGGYIVDADMLSGERLGRAEWKFDDTGVALENGKLVFDEAYDLENPVISRTAAHSSDEVELALEVRYTITIDEIKGDKQFGLGFGIGRLDWDIDAEGAAFLYAQATEKGIGFGLSTVKNGEIVELKALTHYGSKVKDVNIIVRVTNKGALIVLIGDTFFYSGVDGEVTADGYLGFSSAGGWTTEDNYIKASVYNFVAYNEYYAKPETPMMIVADFSNSEFNVNEWALRTSAVGSGTGIVAKDGVLRFEGAGQNAAFAPQFKYSNFEIQLDIFDMKNTLASHTNGVPVVPSQFIELSWGTDGDSADGVISNYMSEYSVLLMPSIDWDSNSPTYLQRHPAGKLSLQFYRNRVYKLGIAVPEKYDFSRPDFDPEARVQLRLVNMDGTATFYMKLETEKEWTEVWSYAYENGVMPLGYIAIRSEGNQFAGTREQYYHGGWFSLDNIILKNFDRNPSLIPVAFESNRIPPVKHYVYKDPYVDSYLIRNTGGKP